MYDYTRKPNENEEKYLFRLGEAKESGLLDAGWEEIASIMNKEFRIDESDYRGSTAYRKQYNVVRKFLDAGVFVENIDEDEDYRIRKEELQKEKQKLTDERTALNKLLREEARFEENLSILEKTIEENSKADFPVVKENRETGEHDLVIQLTDIHYGLDVSSYFGDYNPKIAEQRMGDYLSEIIKIANTHKAKNAYVLLGGDELNGNIHPTVQLQNRENVVDQVIKVSELIADFIYELSKYFETVYVNSVAGNHSRIGKKDEVLRGERMDDLIPWYIQARLGHISSVKYIDDDNYDPTIARFIVHNKEYWMVHGDYDRFSESGLQKLVMMIGIIPEAIFFGHLHKCSYDDISNVKLIRSGSFCGTADDYTVSKRITGKASQMVTVIGKDGVEACYPVTLK